MATFNTLADLGNLATRVALQLHADGPVTAAQGDRTHDPLGTATVIGPYLAVTAAHVVTDYFSTYGVAPDALEANFYLSALMAMEDARSCMEFFVEKIKLVAKTDLAFLLLGPPRSSSAKVGWVLPTVDLLPPRLGSIITGIGFHHATCELDHETRRARIMRHASVTTGTVIEVHEERRDSVRLPFPCFHTDARFENGMSGGPVFTEAGRLCGIVTSTFEPAGPEEPYSSYVSLLWPALATNIEHDRVAPGTSNLLQLMRLGIVPASGHEHFDVTVDEAADTFTITALVPRVRIEESPDPPNSGEQRMVMPFRFRD